MLDTGTLVGIIIGDITLTLLIALSVFCFVSRLKKQNGLEALEGKLWYLCLCLCVLCVWLVIPIRPYGLWLNEVDIQYFKMLTEELQAN